jgi:hypothetical protein
MQEDVYCIHGCTKRGQLGMTGLAEGRACNNDEIPHAIK